MTALEGKVFAITGAASGIGLATAHLLASRGATLALADIRQDPLDAARLDIEDRNTTVEIFSRVVDIVKADEVASWLDETIEQFGKIDGAANLAGVEGRNMLVKTIAELEDEDFDEVIDVNLRGTFNCLRAELQRMKSDASIVNAASIAGLMGAKCGAPYSASKVGRLEHTCI